MRTFSRLPFRRRVLTVPGRELREVTHRKSLCGPNIESNVRTASSWLPGCVSVSAWLAVTFASSKERAASGQDRAHRVVQIALSGQHLELLLAGSKRGPEGDVLFICPATFFPGSAARGQGPETRPSVIGACRRGPNSGPISQDSGGEPPPTALCCTAGSPPPPRKGATCNVAVVALQMARTDVLSCALCLVSDGACLRSRASYLLAPFSYPDTR